MTVHRLMARPVTIRRIDRSDDWSHWPVLCSGDCPRDATLARTTPDGCTEHICEECATGYYGHDPSEWE